MISPDCSPCSRACSTVISSVPVGMIATLGLRRTMHFGVTGPGQRPQVHRREEVIGRQHQFRGDHVLTHRA